MFPLVFLLAFFLSLSLRLDLFLFGFILALYHKPPTVDTSTHKQSLLRSLGSLGSLGELDKQKAFAFIMDPAPI